MQLVANGPDIPDALLQAHEEGRVVNLLNAIISDQPWPLPELSQCLTAISQANPALLQDRRYHRLEEYSRRRAGWLVETTMTLKERFDDFCRQYPGSVAIDSLENPPKGVQKGDYLFEDKTIVCEVKCLEADMRKKLLDIMKADGIDPGQLPKGRHIIEDLYLKLPKKMKGKNRYNQLVKKITSSVANAIDDAANQIRDTKEHLGIPDADGLLVILNEEVNIIGQPLVKERLGLAVRKKNAEGKPYHSQVTRVLHIGETNAVGTPAGDMRINIALPNPHATAKGDIDGFVQKLASAWGDYNGEPLTDDHGIDVNDLMKNSRLYIDVF